jgi:hypothetical protein
MGLDMYLYKKSYVQNWEHTSPEKRHTFEIKMGGEIRKDIKPERICYIVEQIAYWRKFNALHGWFVQNCAGGTDECQDINVSEEHLKELLDTLKKVHKLTSNSKKVTKVLQDWNGKDYEVEVYENENKIKELLEPTQGFFFGGYEIDEYYAEEVKSTIKILKDLIKDNEYGEEFIYRASW